MLIIQVAYTNALYLFILFSLFWDNRISFSWFLLVHSCSKAPSCEILLLDVHFKGNVKIIKYTSFNTKTGFQHWLKSNNYLYVKQVTRKGISQSKTCSLEHLQCFEVTLKELAHVYKKGTGGPLSNDTSNQHLINILVDAWSTNRLSLGQVVCRSTES